MPYSTPRVDLVYPAPNNEPAVCRYRCVVTGSAMPEPRVIVQIESDARGDRTLLDNHNVCDAILNRIFNRELEGVALSLIDVVLSDSVGQFAVTIEADIEDYIQRGNPYRLDHAPGRRGRAYEKISIDSSQLVAGRVRIHSTGAPPAPASDELVAVLNAV
ncbi:TPA: hypothetical protein QDB15_004193 [Burkholderia vietnamiensis]|uniref:Uncharacterized protein n=1 Tax=Burkholderia vietnamiensis TaxID=60552 RepID=A0AA44XXU6_BURVI|nr:hypothetical protein [Burkholderia vietnamiensis]KVS16103.1 hypothetical protein WK32_27735 [Burkholderia vietnamiensis]KVS18791.1 hypothetical protein WK29_11440 [Burkholderia vietnamiensis]MBR8085541.1 hypothetical protein [Burkholderia vietnamiensis]MBR8191571.1 hypothetical protein [Burkholderia vietnamiensis]MCA8210953.1 hypothetical protein [Burkholderia vietnamiensis]